jgi:uncharacterized protein
MKNILFILLLLLNVNISFSQSKIEHNEPQKLEIYRKIFWDSLPKPLNWTNDYENLFTDEEEDYLDSIITDFNNLTGIQISIVTIDTIYTSKQKFDDLTLHIANTWGIGEKNKNNGILIGISRGYRKIRIQNGFGFEEILSDAQTKQIIDNQIIPFFKKNEYFNGTSLGLTTLIKLIFENNIPKRPSSVPIDAFWVGGIDGGNWIIIEKLYDKDHKAKIKIFDDYNGKLIMDNIFQLNCDSELDLKELKNEITNINGKQIYLRTLNGNKKYCFLECKD